MLSSGISLLCVACNIVGVGSLRVAHHAAAAHGQPTRRMLRTGAPFCCGSTAEAVPEDINDENMLRIVLQETTDEETNELVWKYLGYRYDSATGTYDASGVFPKWAKRYPQPPDLIGVTRTYEREVDEPVLRAVQALQKSVPTEHKDNLRQCLKPLGWPGFKLEGLTPNKTRRAQVAQWLIYYRKALHGVSLEELVRRKEARQVEEQARVAAEGTLPPTGTTKQSVL